MTVQQLLNVLNDCLDSGAISKNSELYLRDENGYQYDKPFNKFTEDVAIDSKKGFRLIADDFVLGTSETPLT